MKLYCSICLITLLSFYACNDRRPRSTAEILKHVAESDDINVGNMNFQFDLPQNWYRIDTIMQGAKLCFLMGDNVDGLKPGLNILTEHMHGKEHADYFQGTKQYLIFHNSDIKMVEEGVIDISGTKALWYRFNQIRNGVNRQTVYYSIPVNGISYNITAAVTADGMKKYRPVFDQIVKTFRLIKE